LLVSRASPVPKTATTSSALKPVVAATTTTKPTQLQNAPPPVPLASKSKPKIKLFVQATKANNTAQKTPKFAPALSHEDFLHLLQLKEAFLNLS